MNRTKGLDQAIAPTICISERHLWAESGGPATEPKPQECTEPLGLERVEWLPVEHCQTAWTHGPLGVRKSSWKVAVLSTSPTVTKKSS
jgi:hypothetical protein